jgi:phosphoribosyl 1,2-cyclic phosphate phosphodiesterase
MMNSQMTVTVLGSGTSQGVPIIGCDCAVCTSHDMKDKRLRSSILVKQFGVNVLVDIGPDFRQQMLVNNIDDVDIILLTHEHNDHVGGLDDIRPINFKHKKSIPVYGLKRVVDDISRRYDYAFCNNPNPGTPQVFAKDIDLKKCDHISSVPIQPIPIWHGTLPILGFRFSNFAYICDVSKIDPESIDLLADLDTLIISALHHRPHPAHFTLQEALDMIEIINPKCAYITHMSHEIGLYQDLVDILPHNVRPAYDGMQIHL